MVYRILSWGCGAYCSIQMFHVLVQKYLIMELVHRLRNILRFYEVTGNTRVQDHFDPPINLPLVSQNKHI